eukprot:1045132-Pelagomonas_calceolata.AAC.2
MRASTLPETVAMAALVQRMRAARAGRRCFRGCCRCWCPHTAAPRWGRGRDCRLTRQCCCWPRTAAARRGKNWRQTCRYCCCTAAARWGRSRDWRLMPGRLCLLPGPAPCLYGWVKRVQRVTKGGQNSRGGQLASNTGRALPCDSFSNLTMPTTIIPYRTESVPLRLDILSCPAS